jgi:hypothetical protein
MVDATVAAIPAPLKRLRLAYTECCFLRWKPATDLFQWLSMQALVRTRTKTAPSFQQAELSAGCFERARSFRMTGNTTQFCI